MIYHRGGHLVFHFDIGNYSQALSLLFSGLSPCPSVNDGPFSGDKQAQIAVREPESGLRCHHQVKGDGDPPTEVGPLVFPVASRGRVHCWGAQHTNETVALASVVVAQNDAGRTLPCSPLIDTNIPGPTSSLLELPTIDPLKLSQPQPR